MFFIKFNYLYNYRHLTDQHQEHQTSWSKYVDQRLEHLEYHSIKQNNLHHTLESRCLGFWAVWSFWLTASLQSGKWQLNKKALLTLVEEFWWLWPEVHFQNLKFFIERLEMGDGSESPNPQIHGSESTADIKYGSEQLDILSNQVKNIVLYIV